MCPSGATNWPLQMPWKYIYEAFLFCVGCLLHFNVCYSIPYFDLEVAGIYEGKPSLALRKLGRRLSFVSLLSFYRNNAFIWKVDIFFET